MGKDHKRRLLTEKGLYKRMHGILFALSDGQTLSAQEIRTHDLFRNCRPALVIFVQFNVEKYPVKIQ